MSHRDEHDDASQPHTHHDETIMNTPDLDHPSIDDQDAARLTAYALDELPADQAAEITARLKTDAAARAFVDDVRGTATLLAGGLASETGPGLLAEQRAAIEARLRSGAAETTSAAASGGMRHVLLTFGSVAAAALIVLALGLSGNDDDSRIDTSRGDPSVFNTALSKSGRRPLRNAGGREFEARFTTEAAGGFSANQQPASPFQGGAHQPAGSPDRAREGGGGAGHATPASGGYRGPGGEVAAASREPSDPSPPPGGSGPETPGPAGGVGGPTTGGGGGGGRSNGWADGVGYIGGGGAGGPDAGGGDGGTTVVLTDQVEVKVKVAVRRAPVSKTPGGASATWGNDAANPGVLTGLQGGPTTLPGENASTEAYDAIVENGFKRVIDEPVSTFSTDVDTASYANVRRMLNAGQLPPPGAVRIEELVNYFPYAYEAPTDAHPFATHVEVAACPWNLQHRLVRVGLKGRDIQFLEKKPSNLVFLLDVSGSMNSPDKLPLLQKSMRLLVDQLGEDDHVSIVVYAGSSGLVLPPTAASDRPTILAALERLQAGGSTNGAAGIELAYQTAQAQFVQGGINRVILATDGDFNVGVSDRSSLVKMIEDKAKGGVFLSVLGFGTGNVKDSAMEQLADKGNGNYSYIDTLAEGRKVLVEQMGGTLVTIAKDVKVQIEFNPAQVGAYRLVGYENRLLARQDFNDDTKDAGEIGAGHTVTAIYELMPPGTDPAAPNADPLKYQGGTRPNDSALSGELLTLKLRYKQPDGDTSTKVEYPVRDSGASYGAASGEFKFAAAVASFGMLLRGSEHAGNANYDAVLELAGEGLGHDPGGYRAEFIELVRKAKGLAGK